MWRTTARSERRRRSPDAHPRKPRRWRAASSNTTSAYALLGLGRYGEAIIPLREGIAGLQRNGCGAHSATGYVNLALALFTIGETEESEAHLIAAEQGLTDDTQWLAPYVHYLRGEIAQRRGNHAEARTHYERLREYYPDFQNVADILAVVSLLPVLLPERS